MSSGKLLDGAGVPDCNAQDQILPFHRNTGSFRVCLQLRHNRKQILLACRLVLVDRAQHTR